MTFTTDEKGCGESAELPIGGVVFRLFDSAGNIVKLKAADGWYFIPAEDGNEAFKVNADGKAIIKYLKAGNYSLKEEASAGYAAAESYELTITDEHSEANPYSALIFNAPTALKVYKIKDSDKLPLTGAGFSFKVKDGFLDLGFKTLKFEKLENGWYKQSENGTIDTIMVDKNGEAFIMCLPIGDVWLEETVVPKGYFPVAATKLTFTSDHCVKEPCRSLFPMRPL